MLNRGALIKLILLGLLFYGIFPSTVFATFPAFSPDEGVYLIEEKSGNVILSQNANQRYYPASTTKLMTALILTDNIDNLDEVVTVGDEVHDYGWSDSTAGLWQGQTLTYKDLLYALLIPSGNDAAGTIAINVGRKLLNNPQAERHEAAQAFINAMNAKAESLGLFNTHFVNPHGMYDPNHYTTPEEMAIIAREAFKNGDVKSAASTKKYVLKNDDGTDNIITNTNLLIFDNAAEFGRQIVESPNPNDPNAVAAAKANPDLLNVNPYKTDLVTAAKTGSTDEGGRTFVYLSENLGGAEVIGVLFKTGDNQIFEQSKQILEELNSNYTLTPFSQEDGFYKTQEITENVHFADSNELGVKADTQIQTYSTPEKADDYEQSIRWDSDIINVDDSGNFSLVSSIKPGTKVGAVVLSQQGVPVKTTPIYSTVEMNVKNWQDLILENMHWIALSIFGVLIILVLILEYRRRKNRFVKRSQEQYNNSKF